MIKYLLLYMIIFSIFQTQYLRAEKTKITKKKTQIEEIDFTQELPLNFVSTLGYSFYLNPFEDNTYNNGHGVSLNMDVHRLYEILRLKFLQKNWGKRIFPGISLDYYNFSSTNELFKSSSLIIPGIHVGYNIYTIPLYKPWKIIYMPLFKIGYQHYISKHEFYTPTVEGREWKSYSTYRPMINYSLENSFLIQKNYYVSFMIDYKMIFEDTIRNAFTFKLLTGYNF